MARKSASPIRRVQADLPGPKAGSLSRPTKPQTNANSVYASLRSDILSCRVHPGVKIKLEDASKRFGVSVGAVREALSRLSSEGLVLLRAQRGCFVSPVSVELLQDLTTARVEIELLCLTRSIETGDIAWEREIVSALHWLNHVQKQSATDEATISDEWESAHAAFHASLTAACGSQALRDVRMTLYEKSERYRRLSVPLDRSRRDLHKEHNELAKATLARDQQEASRLLRRHILRTSEIIMKAMSAGNLVRSEIDG